MELNLFLILMLYWNMHMAYSKYCKENNFCILHCGNVTGSHLTWSKVLNGKGTKILTNENGIITKHSDKFPRYSSSGKSLIISKVQHSDAGRFYCNENVVDLSVVTGRIPGPCPSVPTERQTTDNTNGVSTVGRVLMLCGVAVAGLVFILASVAAGRAIAHRAWQEGRDSVLRISHQAAL